MGSRQGESLYASPLDPYDDNEEILHIEATASARSSSACCFPCFCIPKATANHKNIKSDPCEKTVGTLEDEDDAYRVQENKHLDEPKIRTTSSHKLPKDGSNYVVSSAFDESAYFDSIDGQHNNEDSLQHYPNVVSSISSETTDRKYKAPSVIPRHNKLVDGALILEFVKGLLSVLFVNQLVLMVSSSKPNRQRNKHDELNEDNNDEGYPLKT